MTENVSSIKRLPRTVVALLVSVTLLGLALRLYQLDGDSMWADETYTASRSKQDLLSVVTYKPNHTHPPLGDIVTWLFIRLSGDSDFVIRVQAVLFGSLSIMLAFKMGEMLWTSREGMIAAFLLPNAFHVGYSQEARPYALMAFLALLSFIFLAKALRENKRRFWLGFILFTSLSLYNHYFAFLFLPAEGFFAACVLARDRLSYRRKSDRILWGESSEDLSVPAGQTRMLSLSLAVIGLSYLPWLPAMQKHVASLAGSPVATIATAGGLQSSLSVLQSVLTDYSAMVGAALLLWAAMFIVGLAASNRASGMLLISWVGIPLAFLSVVQSDVSSEPRYIMFVLPVSLLVIARGIVSTHHWLIRSASSSSPHRKELSALGTTLIVLLVAGFNVASLTEYYSREKEDWRSAAAFLTENMRAGDIIMADGEEYYRGGDAPRAVTGLTYYLSLHDSDATVLEAGKRLGFTMGREAQPEAQVWGVLWHVSALANLDRLDPQIQVVEFPYVAVIKSTTPSHDTEQNAISVLEALVLIQPRGEARFDLYLALADVHRERGDTAAAVSDLALAESLRPENQRAYTDLGDAYRWLGLLEMAEKAYLGATRLPPGQRSVRGDVNAYSALAGTYELQGRPRDAIVAYEQIVTLDPTNEQAYARLGNAHRGLMEHSKALAAYQQGLEVAPDSAQLYLLLGETYLITGRISDSVTAFERALQIDPTSADAQRTLQLLSDCLETDIPHPLFRGLGWQVAILGYDLSPASLAAGGSVRVTVWWQALQHVERDYTVFIHVLGPDGRLWAQLDELLQYDSRLTSTWEVGQLVAEEYKLALPSDAPPGEYALYAGLYYWETGERLPVWDESGQRLPEDAIVLQHIDVVN